MNIELSLHRLRAQLNSSIRVYKFKVLVEKNKLFNSFELLYDSNYIKNNAKQDYQSISQYVSINTETQNHLIKFEIDYLKENESTREWYTFENFVFAQDLFKQDKILKFQIDEISEIKLNYDIKGQINNSLSEYKKVVDSISANEDPGIIELTKTSNVYLEAIIPFRRVQVAILNFLSTKHYILEFFLYISLIVFIFYPYFVCLSLFIITFISQTKFKLRLQLIQSSIQFFETNEGKIEQTKKNLNYINLVSNIVIDICKKLERVFVDQDRKFYFQFINILKLISIGLILIIIFLPIKIIFTLSISILYALRNYEEVKFAMLYLKPVITFKGKKNTNQAQNLVSENLNNSTLSTMSEDVQNTVQTSIVPKKYFYYENQQWYVGVGFKGTPMSRSNFTDETGKIKIIPESIQPDLGYVWTNDWTIVINKDTDPKGWQYAKTFEGPYRSSAKPFYIVRRRIWERIAEKEKLIQYQIITFIMDGNLIIQKLYELEDFDNIKRCNVVQKG